MNPKISAIILTKNSQRHIRECIESILKQNYPEDIEIIVIDAGSTDKTVTILSEYKLKSSKPFRIIDAPNTTIGKARQIGLEESKYDILAYIDSDVELTHDMWIYNMTIPLDDKNVGGVQTLAKNEPTFMLKIAQKICREPPTFEFKNTVIDKNHREMVAFSHLLLRKSAVLEAGGFKDLNWGEDTDLTDHMMELGYKFIYLPGEKVYHHHVEGWFDYLYRKKLKGHVKRKIDGFMCSLNKSLK